VTDFVDRAHTWGRLKGLRASPPGRAGSGARQKTFTAALGQFEELWDAAEAISDTVSPITLFYGMAQGGRAILAAKMAGGSWEGRSGHGLTLLRPELSSDGRQSMSHFLVKDRGGA
jgi:hypothetical protein